jgi:hypothetical protein
MKKIFTTLFLVLGFYGLSHAQQRYGQQSLAGTTEFGFDVGYNSSYLIESQSGYNSDFVSGFNVGVSADHYFSDNWSLKVKVIYDQKGWGNGFITTPTGEYDNVNFKLNYVTVPVLANWHFGRTRNWYLNFGPYVGFLTSAKETTDNIDVKDSFNSVDGGIALGIGIKIPISDRAKFFIEYDGQGGVTNIFKDSGGDNFQNLRESFNIGINF